MKLAIPTLDGTQVFGHFGRCRAFLILDCEGTDIRSRELRPNLHGHHAHVGGGEGLGHGDHDHRGFIDLLRDCDLVLSGGMGPGAFQALQAAGLKVCHLPAGLRTPEEAAALFLSGALPEGTAESCRGHVHA